jgi:site-specific recombinase XerD
MGSPKQRRGDFGDFTPPEAALVKTMPRSRYAGLTPEVAASLLLDDYAAMRRIEDSTKKEKTCIIRRILQDLSQKGKDLASVEPQDLAGYRAFLKEEVARKVISENYAYNVVKEWNAAVSLVFGETSRPGEGGLKMKNFKQTPKQIDHLVVEDIDAMLNALRFMRFRDETYREAMRTYLELSLPSAGRVSSLNTVALTFACVDRARGKMTFRDVKNLDEHDVVLTERALARIDGQRRFLADRELLVRGDETPMLTVSTGGLMAYQTLNRNLKVLASKAQVQKPVTTHVIRKSTGTLMARENPRLAREQLGITQKVFERHYNQPTIADRMARRDIIPGATARSRSLEERVGALYLDLRRGRISQAEFDREFDRCRLDGVTTPGLKIEDPSFT